VLNPPDLLLDGLLDLTMVPEPSLVSRQCLGKERKKISISNRNNPNPNLTLDRKDKKEKDLPGPYLAVTTAGATFVRGVSTDRASRPLAGPPPLAGVRDRAAGAITEPLDSGAIGERASGGADHHPLSGRMAALWISRDAGLGKKGRSKKRREKEGSLPQLRAGRRSSSPSPAPPATETPPPPESLLILRLQG
jgi:hypothetical protein